MRMEAALDRHVRALNYVRHPVTNPYGLEHAQQYITGRLDELGFAVTLQLVTTDPVPQYNILARMPGDAGPRKLVVEAHYDTVSNSPGADDNASAVAGMLELAAMLGPIPGVEMASFCLEEDNLRGAAAYVDSLAWSECPDFIDLEMIGYREPALLGQKLPLSVAGRRFQIPLPAAGRAIGIIGDWHSRHLARALTKACFRAQQPAVPLSLPALSWLIPDVRRSDHWYFWRRGLKAVMITDGANFRNPHYHRPTDLPETLDLAFAGRVVSGVGYYIAGAYPSG